MPNTSSTAPTVNITAVPTSIGTSATLSASTMSVMGSTAIRDSSSFSLSLGFITSLSFPIPNFDRPQSRYPQSVYISILEKDVSCQVKHTDPPVQFSQRFCVLFITFPDKRYEDITLFAKTFFAFRKGRPPKRTAP